MKHYLSFDVESLGLFGPPFAVGFVVVNKENDLLEEGLWGYDYRNLPPRLNNDQWTIQRGDREWVENSIGAPEAWFNCPNIYKMAEAFYSDWVGFKTIYPGLTMVTDCPFPVEFNFLSFMLHINRVRNINHSPYPVIDVASVLLAHGFDPLGDYPRLEHELPAHNPVADAQQSVRLFLEVLRNGKNANLREVE